MRLLEKYDSIEQTDLKIQGNLLWRIYRNLAKFGIRELDLAIDLLQAARVSSRLLDRRVKLGFTLPPVWYFKNK